MPNGVDLAKYSHYRGETIPFDIVFIGKMDYRPNVDAMLWFGQDVMPYILQRRPQTTLGIIGQRPHVRLAPLKKNTAITITGYVDSVLPYLAGAGVCVGPFPYWRRYTFEVTGSYGHG